MSLPISDPPLKAPPFHVDRKGNRRPSLWADPAESGIAVGLLTWPQQWRFLETVRRDEAFRTELIKALGLQGGLR